jgi:hypothetical protein
MQTTKCLFLLSAAMCACAYAGGAGTNQPRAQATLLVTSVQEARPVVTIQGRYEIETPEFAGEVVRQWRTNYILFSKALVEVAEKQHLDSASLATILQQLPSAPENKHLALLPVIVESTKFHGEWAWEVTLRWEGEKYAAESGKLGHLRCFILSQEALKQRDFSTCY